MQAPESVVDFAVERRRRNARTLSLALTVLGVVGVIACPLAGAPVSATLAGAAQTVVCLIAYFVIRHRWFVPGVLLMILGPLIQHVAIVASMGKLTVLPYMSTLGVLLAAATLPLRRLYLGIVLAVLAIAAEVYFVDLGAMEAIDAAGLLAGSVLFLGVVIVISVLHVHGTERATALAREREEARERAAAAARASEDRYRLIAENTIDLIAVLDADGRSTYLSPSHERVLGHSTDELLGRKLTEMVGSGHRPTAEHCLAEVLATGRSRGELALVSKEGVEILFDSTFTHVRTDGGDLIAVLGRDITEKRALEEKLRRAGRMEALGRMARGVAHDFNNLLTTLLGNAEIAEVQLSPEHPVRASLQNIREAARSAARLTQQLLAFSRSNVSRPTAIHPAQELSRLAALLASVVGRGVNLVIDADPRCPSTLLDAGHFEQLLLNLAANAAHALGGQGSLRVGLRGRQIAGSEVADLKAGDYVELSVEDSGAGIAPEVLPHIFEPFYTTRATSGGTGLGLATCYGIATQHGGQIAVESDVGKGTTFRVLLPVASNVNQGLPLAGQQSDNGSSGSP
jgi:PAS domain S-box-containing protein